MSEPPAVHGHCDERFAPVREAFAANFAEHGDVGAAVAVTVNGAMTVDLWAGWADVERTRPWQRDTIVNVYSTTKGIVATAAHILADRGLLDLDAPVVAVWPEFAQAGKERIPVRWLLTHQAGLPVIDEELPAGATLDWEMMTGALARQAPVWEPGTATGYHTATYGWLVGEVIRRVSGMSAGAFVRDAVARPLGVDFLIGFGPEEDNRVADMIRAKTQASAFTTLLGEPDSLTARSFAVAPPKRGVDVNHREYRASEQPSGNGHTNARALATIYGALACGGEINGVRLLSAEAARRAGEEQVAGEDVILKMPVRRSLGYMLPITDRGDVRGPNSFGHAGAGGSLGYADPDVRVGFGYTMNQIWGGGSTVEVDPRAQRLAAAVYASLAST